MLVKSYDFSISTPINQSHVAWPSGNKKHRTIHGHLSGPVLKTLFNLVPKLYEDVHNVIHDIFWEVIP